MIPIIERIILRERFNICKFFLKTKQNKHGVHCVKATFTIESIICSATEHSYLWLNLYINATLFPFISSHPHKKTKIFYFSLIKLNMFL